MSGFFNSIFSTSTDSVISLANFFECVGIALLVGIIFAVAYRIKNKCSKSFLFMLMLLPLAVTILILMVSGNFGVGIAIAGAFSLVRFRSAPGNAKEIVVIFTVMASGVVIGMGYLAYAVLFAVIVSICILVFDLISSRKTSSEQRTRILRITIPEDLNFGEVFDDIFNEFTEKHERISVKTSGLGSLFKLKYRIILKDEQNEKKFIDELRCRNGNLEINLTSEREEIIAREEL